MDNLERLDLEMRDTARELGYDLVTFEEFKKLHSNDTSGRDMAICHITAVEKLPNGARFTFDNGDTVSAFYNGVVFKNKAKASYMNGRCRVNNIGGYNVNSSMFAEFFIALQSCFYFDNFPESFKDVVSNVKSAVANDETAEKLGAKVNTSLCNVEWTTKSRNSKHAQVVKKILKNNGIAYKFSSWDEEIMELAKKRDWFTLKINLIMKQSIR